jgi:hypothetical protein
LHLKSHPVELNARVGKDGLTVQIEWLKMAMNKGKCMRGTKDRRGGGFERLLLFIIAPYINNFALF